MPLWLRTTWPLLAVLTGGLLVYFEYNQAGGISGEGVFWLVIGGLIVVMGVIDLIQKVGGDGGGDGRGGGKMLD